MKTLKKQLIEWYSTSPSDIKWFSFKEGDMTLQFKNHVINNKPCKVLCILVIAIRKEFRGKGHFKNILNMLEQMFEHVMLDNCVNKFVIQTAKARHYKPIYTQGKINYMRV